eukprot:3383001-Prymnesium_polylepis.1
MNPDLAGIHAQQQQQLMMQQRQQRLVLFKMQQQQLAEKASKEEAPVGYVARLPQPSASSNAPTQCASSPGCRIDGGDMMVTLVDAQTSAHFWRRGRPR